MLKKTKKRQKCPKKEGDLYKNYYGKNPKERCGKKCTAHWKIHDYVKALNDARTGNEDFHEKCQKLLQDPQVKKVRIPKKLKKEFRGKKPYKNCNMRHAVFLEGRKGVKKFIHKLKNVKSRKLKNLVMDPCQTLVNYNHAKYMAKSNCLTHYEHWEGVTPIHPSFEKCRNVDTKKTKGKRTSWRKRALQRGEYESGVEIVGSVPEKFGWNPTLFVCLMALDDKDPNKTNRKALFNKRYNNIAIGVFKEGKKIWYSVSLTDVHMCKAKWIRRITNRKKWRKSVGITKDDIKKQVDATKKYAKKHKSKFKKIVSKKYAKKHKSDFKGSFLKLLGIKSKKK